MQATISGKQFNARPFILAAVAACLIVAVLIAGMARTSDSVATAVVPQATWQQAAQAQFIEENLYLPTGRLAVSGPSYADNQFIEQNTTLPAARVAQSSSYADYQFVEQNLTLPMSPAVTTSLSFADMQMLEQNLYLPTIVTSGADLAMLALIEENSWGAGFTFSGLPEPGTVPQIHEGVVTY